MNKIDKTELDLLTKAAAEFAAGELVDNRQDTDQYPFGPFFSAVLEKAFKLDFFHLTLPTDMGGVGMNVAALAMVLSRLSREDASLGALMLTNCFSQEVILQAEAGKVLAERAGPATGPADFLIACPFFNNPSEITHMARVDQAAPGASGGSAEGVTLSGHLDYLVLGGIADLALVPAAASDQSAWSYFLVDMGQAGVSIGEPVLSLGVRCCPAVDIKLQNAVAVPIGPDGDGRRLFEKAVAKLYVAAAAISAGIMKGSFDAALAYARQREQGGRKLTGWSEMRSMLADMAMHVEVADMVVAEACRCVDCASKGWEQKSLAAAVHVQEAAVAVTSDGIQALGGVGYMQDFGQEKRLRDAQHMKACFGLAPMKRMKLLENMMAS